MATCLLCTSTRAKVRDTAEIPQSQAEAIVLAVCRLIGVRVAVHRLRLTLCPDCVPGEVTRHRDLIVPLDASYHRAYLGIQRKGRKSNP
jgi:hypothetical protein